MGGGVVLFNFMFITTLPSWVCEKKPEVHAMTVISWTLVVSVVMFLFVGWLGGMAFDDYYTTDNTLLSQLHHINLNRMGQIFGNLSVDIYAVAANLASIPIFSIMMRYNLIEDGLMGRKRPTFVSVVVPWVISVFLYCGSGFQNLVQFAGSFTSSIVNFIIPSLLYIEATRRSSRDVGGTLLEAGASANQAGSARIPKAGSSPPVDGDRSGLRSSAASTTRWVRLAWFNLLLMTAVTIVTMSDQILNFGS